MLALDALSQWHLYWVFQFLGTFRFIKNIQVHYLLKSMFLLLQATDMLVVELAADRRVQWLSFILLQARLGIKCKPHIRKPQNHIIQQNQMYGLSWTFGPWSVTNCTGKQHTHTSQTHRVFFFRLKNGSIKSFYLFYRLTLLSTNTLSHTHTHTRTQCFFFRLKNGSIKSKHHKRHNCF